MSGDSIIYSDDGSMSGGDSIIHSDDGCMSGDSIIHSDGGYMSGDYTSYFDDGVVEYSVASILIDFWEKKIHMNPESGISIHSLITN